MIVYDPETKSYSDVSEKEAFTAALRDNVVLVKNHAADSYAYALDIIGKRFPEGEPAIAADAEMALQYVLDMFGGHRWEVAEPAIASNPETAYNYAYHVIGGRWEMAEPTIATSGRCSALYASQVLKGRFLAGEPQISKVADYAYHYASTVLLRRWPEAEDAIFQDAHCRELYCNRFDIFPSYSSGTSEDMLTYKNEKSRSGDT